MPPRKESIREAPELKWIDTSFWCEGCKYHPGPEVDGVPRMKALHRLFKYAEVHARVFGHVVHIDAAFVPQA